MFLIYIRVSCASAGVGPGGGERVESEERGVRGHVLRRRYTYSFREFIYLIRTKRIDYLKD